MRAVVYITSSFSRRIWARSLKGKKACLQTSKFNSQTMQQLPFILSLLKRLPWPVINFYTTRFARPARNLDASKRPTVLWRCALNAVELSIPSKFLSGRLRQDGRISYPFLGYFFRRLEKIPCLQKNKLSCRGIRFFFFFSPFLMRGGWKREKRRKEGRKEGSPEIGPGFVGGSGTRGHLNTGTVEGG